ncbi:MAG: DPP IV N-terminal domain-containing protein [Chitinophagales bacterium]
MRNRFIRPVFASILVFTLFSGYAQQKELTYDQIFKGAQSNVLQSLPNIEGWADDDHYLIMQKDKADNDKLKLMSIDALTGKAEPYTQKAAPASPSFNLNNKEKNPTASPDGKWVAYTRGNNLFAKELSSGKEIQFTRDGSENIYSGYAAWLYYEEILGRASHYKAFWWSPDSKHIVFMHFDETSVPIFPIYNSEGLHGFLEQQHYPKAGDPNPAVKIGLVSVDHPDPVWADFSEKDDQYFGTPIWTPDGNAVWIQWMPRRQNNLKIYAVNPADGSKKALYDEKQDTWIDLDLDDRIEFLSGTKGFVLKSDKTGWMHLYYHKMDGSLVNPITSGDFTVTELVKVDENTKTLFFKARKENSARIDLYKVGLDGKGMTRLTFGEFYHEPNLSPNGKYFITTYSNITTPPKMALLDNKGKLIREFGDSKGTQFGDYALSKTELVRVKSSDGLFELPMSIMYPLHFDPAKKYPVVINIYGGPNAGTVYDIWSRQFLNAQWWANEGLIQVSMDNRSSGHFGKKGMNYIFRQLGKYETEDYMDCGRWLRMQSFVDSSKIFIAGGSFGGYMTCMALTYGADIFNYGVASSSVTDWSLYDTHYTERYMERPQDNENGYKITSPQNYLKKYRGLIRVVHGNLDDNVHMQNSIQLINKLEDMDKHFEFMIYPGERHGWGGLKAVQSRNETRLFIYQNLLNKPMPDVFWR